MKVCSVCRRCYEDLFVSCTDESHGNLSETHFGACDMVAGYQLEQLLDSGVKGETYQARQIETGTSCRIKIFSTNESYGQRFAREAKIAASVFHPNIAGVYEAGSLDSGHLFLVAEDAGGQTLRQLLDNVGVPSLLTAVQIARQAAEAAHAIHVSGLLHRALNPANIILTTDPEHRLLVRVQNADLGGVAEHSIISNKFLIDSALDSLKYFAPEQCSGEESSVQTDVYSLGIVLYEMLAGEPPFDDSKAGGIIEKHKNQSPPEITINSLDLRMLISHTLMESLLKQPRTRQSSANAFARQLRHIEQLATHSPTPPPAMAVPPAPFRPSTGVAATAAVSPAKAPVIEHAAAVVPSQRPVHVVQTQRTVQKEVQPVIAQAAIQPATVESDSNSARTERKLVPVIVIEAKSLPLPPNIEPEPVLVSSIESESLTTAKLEAERVQAVEPEIASIDQGEMTTPLLEESMVESHFRDGKFDHSSHLSRLKRTKKRLRAMLSARAPLLEEPIAENPVEEGKLDHLSHLSRLKRTKKRLRSMLSAPVVGLHLNETVAIEPDFGCEPAEVRSLPVEMPAARPEPARVELLPERSAPIKIEWDQPEDDIPSEADVREVLVNEGMPLPRPAYAAALSAPPEYLFEEELSPLVRLDVETHPVFIKSATVPKEKEGHPVSVREPQKRKAADSYPRDLIFSSYGGQPVRPFSISYRPLLIGSGLAALIVLYLFRGGFLSEYVGTASSRDWVVGQTEHTQGVYQPVVRSSPISQTEQSTSKNVDKAAPEDNDLDVGRLKPLTGKDRAPVSVEKPQAAPVKPSSQSLLEKSASTSPQLKTVAVNRYIEKMPSISSTMVISSENGQIRSKIESDRRPADKRSVSGQAKSPGLTRPRIVKETQR